MDLCDDDLLRLAMNLSFSCSLRMGELLALTWDCVDISDEAMENKTASVYVNKEIQRCNRDALEKPGDKDVLLKFPSVLGKRRCSKKVMHRQPLLINHGLTVLFPSQKGFEPPTPCLGVSTGGGFYKICNVKNSL